MKPRRLVSATTLSISWSRGTVILPRPSPRPSPASRKRGELLSRVLQDRDYVAGRVFEPGDVWPFVAGNSSGDAFLVRHSLVVLELDAFAFQLADRFLDVVDSEVEHRVGRGDVGVPFGVDQDSRTDLQHQAGGDRVHLDAERLAIKLFRRIDVVDRETTERVLCADHLQTPLIW